MTFTSAKEPKKYLNKEIKDSAPTSGRLIQKLAIKMCGVGISIDWVHPKSLSSGLKDEAVFEILEYSHLQPTGVYLKIFEDKESHIWHSLVVGQI